MFLSFNVFGIRYPYSKLITSREMLPKAKSALHKKVKSLKPALMLKSRKFLKHMRKTWVYRPEDIHSRQEICQYFEYLCVISTICSCCCSWGHPSKFKFWTKFPWIIYGALLKIKGAFMGSDKSNEAKLNNPSATSELLTIQSSDTLPSWYPSHRQMIGEGNFKDNNELLNGKKQALIRQKASANLDSPQTSQESQREARLGDKLRVHHTETSIFIKDPPLKQHPSKFHYPPNFLNRPFLQSPVDQGTKFNDYRNQLLEGYNKAKLRPRGKDTLEISSEERHTLRNSLREKLRQLSKEDDIKVDNRQPRIGSLKVANIRSHQGLAGKKNGLKDGSKYTPLNVIAKLMPLTLASQANRDLGGPTKAEAIFRNSVSKIRPSLGGPGAPKRFKMNHPNMQFRPHGKPAFRLSPSFDSVPTEEGHSSHDGEDSESESYDNYEPTGESDSGEPPHSKDRILSDRDRDYSTFEDHNARSAAPRSYGGRDRPTNLNWVGNGENNNGPPQTSEEGPYHKKAPTMSYDSENGYGHDADGLVDSYENVMLEKDLGFGGYCGDKENGLYAEVATKCQQFYACEWGRSHQFTCPYGTAYNSVNYKCDWNYNVEC